MTTYQGLILASKSPRRKELLQDCGFGYRIVSCDCDETIQENLPIEKAIEQIAYQKAKTVWQAFPDQLVLGCDTMVIYQGQPLGKPKDREDAKRMLTQLSGKTHHVISGVAILGADTHIVFHDMTEVTFYDIEEDLLQQYLDSDEPYDKAGAYGIQGKGKLFVKEIHGDYYNVMGLPVAKIYRELKKLIKNQ